jgi:hypothetical protein
LRQLGEEDVKKQETRNLLEKENTALPLKRDGRVFLMEPGSGQETAKQDQRLFGKVFMLLLPRKPDFFLGHHHKLLWETLDMIFKEALQHFDFGFCALII